MRLWAENSGEAVDWYTDLLAESGMEVQLEWNMPEGTYYKEWATGHGTNGEYPSREQDVAKVIDAYITSFDGCEERFETTMQSLIVEDGRVVGVYAQAGDESYLRINASKGVVVATGGYAYNQDMYAALQPTRLSCLGTFDAFPSCTGDGIKALLRIGARMDAVHTSLTFNRCLLAADQKVGNPYQVGADYGYYFFSSQPFLRVDPAGARFHNESAPYDFVMNASSKRPEGQRYWHQIWDANWKDDIYRLHTTGCSTICYREGADHDAWPEMVDEWIAPEMEQFVEAGYIQKADTLDALADKLGFEGAAKENVPGHVRAPKRKLRRAGRSRLRQGTFPSDRAAHPAVLRHHQVLRAHPLHARRHPGEREPATLWRGRRPHRGRVRGGQRPGRVLRRHVPEPGRGHQRRPLRHLWPYGRQGAGGEIGALAAGEAAGRLLRLPRLAAGVHKGFRARFALRAFRAATFSAPSRAALRARLPPC